MEKKSEDLATEEIIRMKDSLKDVPGLSHLKDKSPVSMRVNK